MNRERAKDIGIRAGKTFLQAFLAALTVDLASPPTDGSVWKDMLLAAAAAGISAAMNFVINMLDNELY